MCRPFWGVFVGTMRPRMPAEPGCWGGKLPLIELVSGLYPHCVVTAHQHLDLDALASSFQSLHSQCPSALLRPGYEVD